MQFYDRDGSYIFFRYNDTERVMVAVNLSDRPKIIDWNIYSEMIGAIPTGYDIVSDRTVVTGTDFEIPPYGSAVIEFHI